MEIKEIQDQLNELVTLLRRSEIQRKELLREQAVAITLAKSDSVRHLTSEFRILVVV